MWFALGFVTLIIGVGHQWWMRWHHRWAGVEGSLAGVPCELKVRSHKDLVYGLLVGLQAPETLRFELKREGLWDRFFKWTGLAVEHQFGHSGFDPLIYVSSDDQQLFASLAGNNDFLHAAQHIFAAQIEDRWIKKIVCSGGRLWMVIGCSDGIDRQEEANKRNLDFATDLMPHFLKIQTALSACNPASRPSERDPYLWPATALLAVSSGLAINGVVSWARSLVSSEFIVDSQPLKLYSWAVAACILGALSLAAVIFLRGSSRVHLVLLELSLVGTFGAISTSSNGLRSANIEFDTSPAVQVQRPLTGKSVRERKRLFGATRTTYLLEYREWFGELGYRSIAVPAATYEQVSYGDYLEFEQHQGYFGWRWAEFKAWRPQPAI